MSSEVTLTMSFSISRLAQFSGFSETLIRVWERRFAFLQPKRLENGHRRYTPEDLTVLQSVRALLDEGSKIGDIARMGRDELIRRDASGASTPLGKVALLSPAEEDYLDGRHPEIAWSILEALPCAVIVTDRAGLVRWVNRGVAALCGYDLADLHGLSPGRVLQGPASDRLAVEQMRAAIISRRPCSVSLLNYQKSGEPYLALVDVAPLGFGVHHVGFVATARRIERSRR
jgi:PAS domain S-box-containing protein